MKDKDFYFKFFYKFRFLFFILFFILISNILIFTNISELDIKGNSWHSKEEIEEILFEEKFSRNSFLNFVKVILKNKKKIAFIEDYRINFKSPKKIELEVYEKSIVACVEYMSSYMYFDKDGILVESSTEKLDKIPIVKNLRIDNFVLYKKLGVDDEEIFKEILNLTQALSLKEIFVDYIVYNSSENVSAKINDILIEFGSIRDINDKILVLSDILPQIKDLSGSLYLNISKNDESLETYTFKKNKK